MLLSPRREVLIDGPREEKDDDNGCSDPHGAVEVGIAFKHVEEVGAGVDGRCAAAEHFGRVDVEGLRIKGEAPEVVFAGGRGGGRCGAGEEGGSVGLDFGGAAVGRGLGVEIGAVEFEVFLEIGVA